MLAVHFLVLYLKVGGQPLGDGMRGVDDEDALTLAHLVPGKGAGGAHQAHKGLGLVAGVQHDQAHAGEHVHLHPLGYLVGHQMVAYMAPPYQHISIGQHFLGQAALGIIQRGGANGDVLAFQHALDSHVQAVRVYGGGAGIVFFMIEFIPYGYADHGNLPPLSHYVYLL